MFNATEFVYDGTFSNKYGLKIASFNSSALEETSYTQPEIVVGKPSKSKRFNYLDIKYDSTPTIEFAIVSETVIPDNVLRDVLVWLDSRKGFKPLVILQPELDETTYYCIFTVTSMIYHAGYCVGLNLSATFDSLYTYGNPTVEEITGTGEEVEMAIYNYSDMIDEYTYPIVEFTNTLDKGTVEIINTTDNESRVFSFKDLYANVPYKVDNETKIISSELDGNNYLERFNKNWLRLLRGENILKIKINGSVKVTCPYYKRIRL